MGVNMCPFRSARLAVREIWLLCQTQKIRTEDELKALQAIAHDAETILQVHYDAVAEKRRKELERVA